jgi:hypothetical protein
LFSYFLCHNYFSNIFIITSITVSFACSGETFFALGAGCTPGFGFLKGFGLVFGVGLVIGFVGAGFVIGSGCCSLFSLFFALGAGCTPGFGFLKGFGLVFGVSFVPGSTFGFGFEGATSVPNPV